jgi:hypothetical protein
LSRGCGAPRRASALVDAVVSQTVASITVLPSPPRAVMAFIIALVVSARETAVSAVSAALVPSRSATFTLIITSLVPVFSSLSIVSIVTPSSATVVLVVALVVVVVIASSLCIPLRESSAGPVAVTVA